MKIPVVDHSKSRLVYVSRLMTAREFRQACQQFRQQEATVRRKSFVTVN